ncbi:unnamed protein product [Arabis nemorensis]|uniref:PHD-type domain-containing protein n=1 Tax=Arabis nemorensis TaxID=586526 RepID=A0A565BKD0_9BRAS|nr:unnamed protein product [Arabis nemorensis]
MAKGTASGEFVLVSQVRTGCKRELQFVLKSQSEICGGESLGRTRASKSLNADSNAKKPRSRSALKPVVKKMRLTKDEEEAVIMSVSALEEDESALVDIEEAKGFTSGSAVSEDERENGKGLETQNVVMNEDHSREQPDKENSREIVVACPANLAELAKLASRSSHVKSERDLGNYKPCRRLTRSMLKPEGNKSEANGDADHIIPESQDYCVHEQNSADPCAGSSQMSGRVHKKEVSDTAADKPLRRLTRSLVKQESDSDNLNLENNTKPADSVKVDVHVNDVEMDDVQRPSVTTYPMRGRPKKFLRNFPAKLKEIFDSRILEGLTVYYIRAAKMREAGTRGLKGVIKGSGVLCFCCACKGTQVVSPAVYEQHASSTNKRPPEYILLESGFTLRDVMNACRETPLPKLQEKLLLVVGPALKKSSLCFNCQGPMVEACDSNALVLCKPCLEIKEPKLHTSPSIANDALQGSSKPGVVPNTILSRSISSPGRSSRREQPTRKSPEPGVVPGAIRSESKSSSIKSNQGKLTRKDLRLHKLVFEDDILPDGTEVGYFVAGKKMLVGYKKGFGIHCSCCNKVVSPSSFEAHAGCASRRKPFQHIYTTNGVSLHELSVALSMDQRFSIQENDDLCSICKDGGDLLCCDTCPRSYHIECASLPSPPSERWSCKYCVNMVEREKFVDSNLNAIAAGRVHGVDAIDQITKRCIRIVSSLASELPSVCVLCRGHSFSRMGFNSRTVIICDQCEKEFHVGCLKEHNIADLKELPEEQWFCSLDCKMINTSLGSLIVHGEEKLSSNLLLNFLKKKQNPDEESCPVDNTTPDIRWRVLSGKLASSEDTKILLTKAVSILHERFDPISESGTRGDLIPAMVYGRQAKGQDFSGMYCTMLTVDEVIVSVGIFRIFGSELAELPLVATSKDCQGKGYFQCLFACIQRLLGFLNVKHLVLPAADEAKSIWTDKFGFTKMTQEEVNDYRKDFSVMIFHGTSMLRKTVPAPRAASKQEDSMEQ